MDRKTHLRAGLFASALLFTTSLASSGFAEEYQSLPDLSPDEIALDVKREFNNRTGQTEFVAPTYDPFEEDRAMAGSVSLRSVSTPVTAIDGEVFTNGVILDLGFYYNSHSDDPFDVRGFTDAAYLSGSLAPAVLRDNRVLECSRNVQDVVYDHSYYYAPTFSLNLFRPSRYYGGYHRYGRFDRPYWRSQGRGYGGHYGGWSRGRYDGYRGRGGNSRRDDRGRDRDRDRDRDGSRDRDRDGDRGHRRDNNSRIAGQIIQSDRSGRSRVTVGQGPLRAENRRDRSDRGDSANDRSRGNRGAGSRQRDTDRSDRGDRNRDRGNRRQTSSENTVIRAVPSLSQRREKEPERRTRAARSDRGQVKSPSSQREIRSTPRRQTRPAPTPAVRSVPTRSAPTPRSRPTRSAPPSRARPPKRSAPNRVTPQTIKGGHSGNSKAVLKFFQLGDSYSRDVVRNVDVDCAREETLSVFIPANRLEAARYDGLTILALDVEGREYPIFVPPNYIEGFKQAIGGRYNTGSTVTVSNPQPVYRSTEPLRSPRPLRELEPQNCPTGTVAQPDGTCMIDETNRYPQ